MGRPRATSAKDGATHEVACDVAAAQAMGENHTGLPV